ncbi:U-box domain-containing protein 62 [Nymphaea thermarum]|nr:U-box domain-containing protein 62 [Nymphaea thermarum]
MVSEGMGNGLSPAIVFHDDGAAAFGSSRKTAPVGAFVDQKLFSDDRERYFRGQSDFRRGMFCSEEERRSGASGSGQEVGQSRRSDGRDWRQRGESDCDDDDDDDEDDDEDEEEDDDGGEGEMEALVNGKGGSKPIMPGNDGAKDTNIHVSSNNGSGGGDNSTSGGSLLSVSEKVREGNLERENGGNKGNSEKHLPSFGMGRGLLGKDPTVTNSAAVGLNECQPGRPDDCSSTRYKNAVTVAEPDSYYPHILQGTSISSAHKEAGGENGCGFNGRKDAPLSGEPGDSLRAILSDPLTGALMDDAMILPCGHSFGSGGIQQVLRMQACYTCGQAISADSMAPNLSLRSAVQAYRREEEFQLSKASKRRRERFEQEKGSFGELLLDGSRSRGVQFPFAVSDRVIIKGNKRTPQRFVGREAVVTTQCLNGWYVVKTLDNAESVKLQYRSLSKVGTRPPSNGMSSKAVAVVPNWL